MPFNELQRRDSWPPTIVRLRNEVEEDEEASEIDDDPFSFFLTSPDDIIDDDEDLSAGIESSTSPKTLQVCEVSPSTIQKHSPPLPIDDEDEGEYDEDEDIDFGLAMPLSLKDFSRKHTNVNDGRQSRSSQRAEDGLKGLGISVPEFTPTLRGRAVVRLTPGRGRGQTRSLSARRPRSWRAPSPDLGSIMEERESDEDIRNEEGLVPRIEFSVSAPATSYMEQATALPAKPKKRVHWAF